MNESRVVASRWRGCFSRWDSWFEASVQHWPGCFVRQTRHPKFGHGRTKFHAAAPCPPCTLKAPRPKSETATSKINLFEQKQVPKPSISSPSQNHPTLPTLTPKNLKTCQHNPGRTYREWGWIRPVACGLASPRPRASYTISCHLRGAGSAAVQSISKPRAVLDCGGSLPKP